MRAALSPATRHFRSIATWLSALLVLSGACAVHADWTYIDTTSVASDIAPIGVVPDAGGFWLLGTSGRVNVVARYGNDALLQSIHYVDAFVTQPLAAGSPQTLQRAFALSDGGFAATLTSSNGFDFSYCTLERFDAHGATVWTAQLPADCDLLGMDAHGGGWITSQQGLLRISADGVATNVAEHGVVAGAVEAQSARLFAVTQPMPDQGAATQPATIVAYDAGGAAHTLYTSSDATLNISMLRIGSNGNLYALGTLGGAPRVVHALSLTPAGTLRWERSLGIAVDLPIDDYPVAATQLADDTLLVLDKQELVLAFHDDGGASVGNALGNGFVCDPSQGCADRLAVSADGAPVALLTARATQLVRFTLDNAVTVSTDLPDIPPQNATLNLLANGDALIGAGSAGPALIHRIDGAGHALAAPPLQQVAQSGALLDDVSLAADSSMYLVSRAQITIATPSESGSAHRLMLSKLGADGARVWQQTLDAYSDVTHYDIGTDRMCAAGFQPASGMWDVECRFSATGSVLWSTPVGDGGGLVGTRLLADNTVMVIFATPQFMRQIVLGTDGNVQHDAVLGAFDAATSPYAIAANGTVVVSALNADGRVHAWDRNGAELYATPPPPLPIDAPMRADYTPQLADDGSALLTFDAYGAQQFGTFLLALSADGEVRWLQQQPLAERNVAVRHLDADSATVFSWSAATQLRMRKLSAVDGSLQTQAFIDEEPYSQFPLVDTFTGLLVDRSAMRLANRVRVRLLDPRDGHVLRNFAEDCGNGLCATFTADFAALSPERTLRVARSTFDAAVGEHFRVAAFADADQAGQTVRIDQAGVAGIWFGSYESGQGFALDYIASADTIFMPWFTYAWYGGNDPAALNWYTLQGTLQPNERSVNLQIGVADPGAFDAGAVGVQQAGTAVLTLRDCNSGLLIYQFDSDVSLGFGGAIALTRLSPSTSPCVLADGSTAPAQNTNPPNAGFDARQSGSWFQAQTAGQGIQFTIVPAGGDYAGLVYGAWFTFDPADAPDDPTQQHWFTLQGNLADAVAGKVTLSILSTLGGSLDALPTGNTAQIGHATLTMHACDSAQLDYQFDSSELAHAYRGKAGSMALGKIGGCNP